MAHDADKELLDQSSIDLNTSPNLPACPPTVGMDVDSLSSETKAALTRGYQTDVPGKDQYAGDGLPQTLEFAGNSKGPDPAAVEGGPVDNGFLGRSKLLSER